MKKLRGFTLIELIVVIAIIGILAAIIVPSMIGYVQHARASRMNANARSVFEGAQLAITDTLSGGGIIASNGVYTNSADGDCESSSGTYVCNLENYLGSNFEGYFLFVTDSSGITCEYALWSENPIPASAASGGQLSLDEVKASIGTSLPKGCHPLKATS